MNRWVKKQIRYKRRDRPEEIDQNATQRNRGVKYERNVKRHGGQKEKV